jgi:RNA recognition motif-containing protein
MPGSLASPPKDRVSTRLYAGNLPLSATAEMLAAKFAKFGAVLSVTLDRNGITGVSRRGAFVEMRDSVEATRAIQALNLASFDGRLMSVYRAVAAVPTVAK